MCPVPASPLVGDVSLAFPADPVWVRHARDAVRTAMRSVADVKEELVETAVLLTSEVVSNAVVASTAADRAGLVGVRVGWEERGPVRVYVQDQAPGEPAEPSRPPGPEEEHGRGLLLLALQAAEWGVCRHLPGLGKAVWFALER
jgi:anti-sigma regulatory factor (Ser/Thr protein kinase)